MFLVGVEWEVQEVSGCCEEGKWMEVFLLYGELYMRRGIGSLMHR